MLQEPPPLQLLVVRTTAAAAEAIEASLDEKGALGSAIERRRGARLVRLQAYFPAEMHVPVEWVRETLANLHACGVPIGPGEVRLVPLHPQDWAETWKKHFHATQVTSRLWIVPTWEEVPPEANEVIRMDPGMAFGQGDHPTTRGCLEMLERVAGDSSVERLPPAPTADVGTGTGILAIRAVQLGLGPVEAFDTDPDAIRAARENAVANGVRDRITFRSGSLPAHGVGPYRWIVANIFFSILVDLLPRFSRSLDPAGDLVVAGILGDQEERFTAEAWACGLRVNDRICQPVEPGEKRWPVLRLRLRAAPPPGQG